MHNCFVDVPFQKPVSGLMTFSLIVMGYYISDLFDTIKLYWESSDFWEMMFHHCLTITLFAGMFMQNQLRAGVIVSYIHNATDIMTNVCRASSQTNYNKLSEWSFFISTIAWIYLRNIVLPLVTYACWTKASYSLELESFYGLHYYLSLFLTFLCGMHVYWLILFLRITYNYWRTSGFEALKDRQNFRMSDQSTKGELPSTKVK